MHLLDCGTTWQLSGKSQGGVVHVEHPSGMSAGGDVPGVGSNTASVSSSFQMNEAK
jgi:hypothetical protein